MITARLTAFALALLLRCPHSVVLCFLLALCERPAKPRLPQASV